jgi:hypothetical protein
MKAFDKLPAVVRKALAESDHNWSAAQALRELRKRKANRKPQVRDAATLAAFIRQSDIDKHACDASAGLVCPLGALTMPRFPEPPLRPLARRDASGFVRD